ncbi:rhomboid family intramembrane serine protease [Staphylococcus agnetis]|uniref:rhomboid family intramembrane serine protease n=1 Tax=Staphylococcus agnetis TaxID=985762 RepID=UPI00208DFC85|nr:rhomboid family intramembrane serine protease [Staphylococcus agnetis]MCO4327905.1 rhomboid family intramembrane serine protease [Staphylococcus agnetis]
MEKQQSSSFIRFFTTLDAVTKVLLVINVIAYLLILIEFKKEAIFGLDIEHIIQVGGVSGESNWTTILISMFIHYNLMHVMVNMAILVMLSRMITHYFSPMTYLGVYLFSGIIGNIITKDFAPNIVSLGASGGIYGLIGLLLLSALIKKKYPDLNDMFLIILVMAITFVVLSFLSPISNNISHIAGMSVGVVLGLFIQIFKCEVIRESDYS